VINRLTIILLLTGLIVTGCKPVTTRQETRPVVTVSILPFRYFVEQLAGDRFEVNVLVPPGSSHHAYDPSPRQLQDLEKSGVFFIDGYLGFEQFWVPKVRKSHPGLRIVNLSEGIDLITIEGAEGESGRGENPHAHEHAGPDPHFWLSFREARTMAASIAKGLTEAYPAEGILIRDNLDRLLTRFDSLDRATDLSLSGHRNRSFIVFHPALNYYARDYGLVQYAMEQGGKEPTAAHFRFLTDQAKRDSIRVILIQREYDQENVQALARETGAGIRVIDPMSEEWEKEMTRIAAVLKEEGERRKEEGER